MKMKFSKANDEQWTDSSILFIDIVKFSLLHEPKQIEAYNCLWGICKKLLRDFIEYNDYLLKSTGDGILLIAYNSAINVINISRDVQIFLKTTSSLKIRQGINCGKVLPINTRMDAIGDPINMCQRIMDCGNDNHILVSSSYVDSKIGSRPPREKLYYLGNYIVKHNINVILYNYYDEICGNKNTPEKGRFPSLAPFFNTGRWKNLLDNCEIIDLSHEIKNDLPCTFSTQHSYCIDVNISTGQGVGVSFLTSILSNLPMNYGTHIDFPGHLINTEDKLLHEKVGGYKLNSFIAEAVTIDVSHKLDTIRPYFNNKGDLDFNKLRDNIKSVYDFINLIETLKITPNDISHIIDDDIKGKAILFYTGLDQYWNYKSYYPSEYAYFFNPYISYEVAEILVSLNISLVGIDTLQIENPIINFNGKESHFTFDNYKEAIYSRLKHLYDNEFAHPIFLNKGIFIVENLKNLNRILGHNSLFCSVPLKLYCADCTDNSITRAFAINIR